MSGSEDDRAGNRDYFDDELKALVSSAIALLKAKETREELQSEEIRSRAETHFFKSERFWTSVIAIALSISAILLFYFALFEPYTDIRDEYEKAKLEAAAAIAEKAEAEAETATWRAKQLEFQSDINLKQRESELARTAEEIKTLKVQRDSMLVRIDKINKQHEAALGEVEKQYQGIIQRKEWELRQENVDKNRLNQELLDANKKLEAAVEAREALGKRNADIQQELACGQDTIEFVVYKALGLRDLLTEDYGEEDVARRREVCWNARDKENFGAPVWLAPDGPYLMACFCG